MSNVSTTKTANIHARIDLEIKEKSMDILDKLGISVTQFIELNLRQLIKEKSLRFELELIKGDKKENYTGVKDLEHFKKLIA